MASTTQRKANSNASKSVPLEKNITAAILKHLNGLPLCYAKKTHGSSYQHGEPDILGCLAGRSLALEVKRPKAIGQTTEQTPEGWARAGATALQANRLTKWQAAGAIAGVVTSVEEVKELLGLKD